MKKVIAAAALAWAGAAVLLLGQSASGTLSDGGIGLTVDSTYARSAFGAAIGESGGRTTAPVAASAPPAAQAPATAASSAAPASPQSPAPSHPLLKCMLAVSGFRNLVWCGEVFLSVLWVDGSVGPCAR